MKVWKAGIKMTDSDSVKAIDLSRKTLVDLELFHLNSHVILDSVHPNHASIDDRHEPIKSRWMAGGAQLPAEQTFKMVSCGDGNPSSFDRTT